MAVVLEEIIGKVRGYKYIKFIWKKKGFAGSDDKSG
jgi:hypothetical protein